MSKLEIPHKDDLATNSKLPGMLTENFKSIEQEESQLRNDLNDETDARINGDGKLQSQIDAIIQRLDTNEKSIADLQTRMKTAEDHIKKLDDIIFGMEYIDDTDEFMLDNSTPNPSEVEINDDVAVDDDNAEVVKELPHEVISNEVS
ncbi:hypothetical protein QUW12_05215 [Limosilactobacillus vaginalis]|nr:hypothetical protein [Limosilactobacillus vaginalis]